MNCAEVHLSLRRLHDLLGFPNTIEIVDMHYDRWYPDRIRLLLIGPTLPDCPDGLIPSIRSIEDVQ